MRALLLALLVATSAHAAPREQAYTAAAADCATTAAGLAAGFAEASPLGPLLACALKPALIESANKEPEPHRTHSLHAIESTWNAAAVANIATLIGLPFPANVVVGIGAGLVTWQRGEPERLFAAACVRHKEVFPDTAHLPCQFNKQ